MRLSITTVGRLLIAATLILHGATVANAALISFSDAAPLSDAEISGVLSVSGFDPSLGTLTAVHWEVTGAIASILGIENRSVGTISGSAFTSVDFDVDSSLLSLGASPDFNVTGSTGPVALGAGSSALIPVTATTTLSGSEAPGSAFFLPTSVTLSYLSLTSFGGTGFGGDLSISQATDAGILFTVDYEYTVVPLPAAAPLLGAGLVLFGLLARRQRRPHVVSS